MVLLGLFLLAVLLGAGACAPAVPVAGTAVQAPTASGAVDESSGPADAESRRSGSLRQDQISIRMTMGDLRVELTPLATWVLEAAAPDTHNRLDRIAQAHAPSLVQRTGEADAVLILVTFSGARPGTEFQPNDLHLISRGIRERPLAIQAITPTWGRHVLGQRENAVAVYAYAGSVDLSRDLVVSYQGEENASWSNVVTAVEAERGRISRP